MLNNLKVPLFWSVLITALAIDSGIAFNSTNLDSSGQLEGTFSSSILYIKLFNFNQFPNSVALFTDVQSNTIAEIGFANSIIDIESEFTAIDSEFTTNPFVFAYTNFKTKLAGIGSDYLVNSFLTSTLSGGFLIPAEESLSFDFNAFLFVGNSTDNLENNSASASGKINLFFWNSQQENPENIFNLLAGVNTNSNSQFNQDIFKFQSSPNITLSYYNELQILEELQESMLVAFSGSFEKYFEEDTFLVLGITTESCNYTSNNLDVCVKVPEPSNTLALILLPLLGLSSGKNKLYKVFKAGKTKLKNLSKNLNFF